MRAWALASLMLWAGALPAAAPTAVALKATATAHGPNVRLGDVVEGLPPVAAAISIKASGLPGGTVSVDGALVALRLRRAPGGPYQLGGARQCKVSVGQVVVPGQALRDFAQDFLRERLSGTPGAEISPLGAVADLRLYDAPVRLQVDPPAEGTLRGNLVLRVRALQEEAGGGERETATVPVSFLVKRREQRLVATRAIRKGDILGADNLALAAGDTTYDDRGFDSLDPVEGKSARAYIGAGKTLTRSLVEFPPLVRRGDMVRVLVRSGSVLVEAAGKALRDAREGESLPVELTGTKKHLQARCVEAGVVVHEAR